MRVTVSGLPGSGTSSLAKAISSRHGYELISAGEVFRQMAEERKMDLAEFGRLAREDPSFDKLIDDRQRENAMKRDDIIVEGRLSGWFVKDADLKIWLSASLQCRVERIIDRDQTADKETALKLTLEREECEAVRYHNYYSIDISDLSPYHLVLDSERFGVEELANLVDTALEIVRKQSD
ncbi:MAG TPA: AAA family ATPase [Methanoregulaceae archaeon]|nr:AAA family ATPase [Methanoregulaceae archaeon]